MFFSAEKPVFKKVGMGFAEGQNAVSKAACSLKKNLFRGENVLFQPTPDGRQTGISCEQIRTGI